MRSISNTTGSHNDGSPSGETGNFAKAFDGKSYYQELTDQANRVSLIKIFKHYGVFLNQYNKKAICPFKSHKGGRENTPSFVFYPETNSYCCFGCRVGSHACDFVAEMEHCNKIRAAHKILELFKLDIDENFIDNKTNFSERLEIMMEFSNTVREFYQTYSSSEARVYVEAACEKYDILNLTHSLENEALHSIAKQLKAYILSYTP